MADSDAALIGVWPCGCVTMALARPDENLTKRDEREMARMIRDGASIERTTVGEAKAREHFLVSSCPHTPKGWKKRA